MKRRRSKLIRKTWPRIRLLANGTYQVDGRRKGVAARQERFDTKAKAEKRARELEQDFAREGAEGAALTSTLRVAAMTAAKILAPYGKDLVDAARHYAAHLDAQLRLETSKFVAELADDWLASKKSRARKILRPESIAALESGKKFLVEKFGERRVLAVQKSDICSALDKHDVGLRRRHNLCSIMSQFFNWCLEGGHCTTNPCPTGEYIPEKNDHIAIATPRQARYCLRLCERKYPHLILYHAIGFFAGLRPFELAKLRPDDISLQHGEILVRADTSKSKRTRVVKIEPNLRAWIVRYLDKDKEEVVRSKNFTNAIKKLRADLGYRVGGENKDAEKYPQDLMRHSFGSYHLKKYSHRGILAEQMGNSIAVVGEHYVNPRITPNDLAAYWAIRPKSDQAAVTAEMDEMEAAATRPKKKRRGRTR